MCMCSLGRREPTDTEPGREPATETVSLSFSRGGSEPSETVHVRVPA